VPGRGPGLGVERPSLRSEPPPNISGPVERHHDVASLPDRAEHDEAPTVGLNVVLGVRYPSLEVISEEPPPADDRQRERRGEGGFVNGSPSHAPVIESPAIGEIGTEAHNISTPYPTRRGFRLQHGFAPRAGLNLAGQTEPYHHVPFFYSERSIRCHSAAGSTGSSDGHAATAAALKGAGAGVGGDPAHPSSRGARTSHQCRSRMDRRSTLMTSRPRDKARAQDAPAGEFFKGRLFLES